MVYFMKGFLIYYDNSKKFRNTHPDPCLSEFTYGNKENYASFIRNRMSKGDCVFFHATLQEPSYGRYITSCFVIERIMEGDLARNNEEICNKYENVHLHEDRYNDVIIFGNKDKSIDIRKKPIRFNRQIAEKLTFNSKNDKIIFKNDFSDFECISSSTRPFRELTDISREFLWNLCKKIR